MSRGATANSRTTQTFRLVQSKDELTNWSAACGRGRTGQVYLPEQERAGLRHIRPSRDCALLVLRDSCPPRSFLRERRNVLHLETQANAPTADRIRGCECRQGSPRDLQ